MTRVQSLVALSILSLTSMLAAEQAAPPPGWRSLSFGPPSDRNNISLSAASLTADAMSLAALIALAHDVPEARVIGPAVLRDVRYAVDAIAERDDRAEFRVLLQKALADRFKVALHPGRSALDVLVLGRAPVDQALRADGSSDGFSGRPGGLSGAGTIQSIARFIEREFERPIVDESGLTGSFTVNLLWQQRDVKSLASALKDRFGLELKEDRRELDVLIVDRVEPLGK